MAKFRMSPAVLRAVAAKTRRDYKWFIGDVLQTRLYPKTIEIIDAVQKYDRVAVASCHASSKTFTSARIALAFLMAHPGESIVITTAPTKRQVEDLLWKEIAVAHQGSLIPIGGDLLRTELRLSRDWYMKGFTARQGEGVAFQGYHAPHILGIFDEASGVDPEFYSAFETIRSGGHVKWLLIGNPTSTDGPFFDAFTRHRHLWHRIHISAFDTPNVQARKLRIPGMVTYDWVREYFLKEGPDSPLYQIRVLGQFPREGDSNLIQVVWVEMARNEPPPFDPEVETFVAGFDAAHEGLDESALAVRLGPRLIGGVSTWRGMDTMKSVRLIMDHELPGGVTLQALKENRRLEAINCDVVGYGAGVADRLDELGWPVNRVNGAMRATAFDHKYLNLRAQMWWHLRTAFKERAIGGLIDEVTEQQLTSVRYEITTDDKIKVERKEDYKKRMKFSPDRAEALLYCFMDAQTDVQGMDLAGFGGYGFVDTAPTDHPDVYAVEAERDHDDYAAIDAWLERDAILVGDEAPTRVRGMDRGLRSRRYRQMAGV